MAGQVRDILAEIEANYAKLTPKLRGIADYVRSEPESFIRLTSREICTALGTSEPTLIRFCKDFGYSGLAEFRIDLALALAGASGSEPRFIEPVLQDRRTINLESKRRIARAAAPLFASGSIVKPGSALLDTSFTLHDQSPRNGGIGDLSTFGPSNCEPATQEGLRAGGDGMSFAHHHRPERVQIPLEERKISLGPIGQLSAVFIRQLRPPRFLEFGEQQVIEIGSAARCCV